LKDLFALIIEDEIDLALLFSLALGSAGFETEIVPTGDAALTRLQDAEPDVVVLDLHLPQVGGADILRRIRADERLAETRVILTTADARQAEALQDQADLVLIKPVGFGQLRDLAARVGFAQPPDETSAP